MRHVVFATVAAFGLMAGAAMAQDVGYDATAPRPPIPGPAFTPIRPMPSPPLHPAAGRGSVPAGAATSSSTLVTGVNGSARQTKIFAATAAQSPRKPVPDDKHTG
jgi:hypothetical protein